MYLKALILMYMVTFVVSGVFTELENIAENNLDSLFHLSKRKNQYSFDSLRFDSKYVFHTISRLKDFERKQAFEEQLKKDREAKLKHDIEQEKLRKHKEKANSDGLFSGKARSSILRNFAGRIY